jgi:hypothetical protein
MIQKSHRYEICARRGQNQEIVTVTESGSCVLACIGQSGEIPLLTGGNEGDDRVANPLMFFAGTVLSGSESHPAPHDLRADVCTGSCSLIRGLLYLYMHVLVDFTTPP